MDNNSNDYSEYLASLEKSLQKERQSEQKPVSQRTRTVTSDRRTVRKKQRSRLNWKFIFLCMVSLALVVLLVVCVAWKLPDNKKKANEQPQVAKVEEEVPQKYIPKKAKVTKNTLEIDDSTGVQSESVIFINADSNEVVAQKNSSARLYPASTTKIMTLLVAVENTTDFDDTFEMTYAITDPLYRQNATVAGFSSGEKPTITDMLYGTILPSGADAAIGLALKISGSEEGFVALMNQKVKELGLKNTHFENVSGLHSENHYTTVEDMAVIVRAAFDNEICRKVLSTYKYTTSPTPQHPEGINLSATIFNYMYGTEPDGADIQGGKTGYTQEAGYCIASFGVTNSGENVFCVAFKAPSKWPAFYDQIKLYSLYSNK